MKVSYLPKCFRYKFQHFVIWNAFGVEKVCNQTSIMCYITRCSLISKNIYY